MFSSVKRGINRIGILLVIGMIFYISAMNEAKFLGPVFAPVFLGFGLTFFSMAISDFALRILQPRVDAQVVANDAVKNQNIGSGLVYLGRSLLAIMVMLIMVSASRV